MFCYDVQATSMPLQLIGPTCIMLSSLFTRSVKMTIKIEKSYYNGTGRMVPGPVKSGCISRCYENDLTQMSLTGKKGQK